MPATFSIAIADANSSAAGKHNGLALTVVSLLQPIRPAVFDPSEAELAIGNLLRANFQFVRGPVRDERRQVWLSGAAGWEFCGRQLIHYQIKQNDQGVLITLEVHSDAAPANEPGAG